MSAKKDKLSSFSAVSNKGPAKLNIPADNLNATSLILHSGLKSPGTGEQSGSPLLTDSTGTPENSAANLTKPEKFMNFLQGNGVRMAFVRTLVALYEEDEKPDEPLPFICGLMGRGLPTEDEVLEKQEELKQLRLSYHTKQEENKTLRLRLLKYITPEHDEEMGEYDFGFEFEYDPNNYNYLNAKYNTAEEEGHDADAEETPIKSGDRKVSNKL